MTDPDAPLRVQVSHSTRANRYPVVFSVAAQLVAAAGIERPRILSYGASSGEESQTLSETYFPGAPILGLDVSGEMIAQARERYGANSDLRFEKSGVYQPEAESFDVIFAMSVLCRWPDSRESDDIAALFPFAQFERQAEYLDALVRPGGLLVIYNASYSFLHARASAHYDLIVHPRIRTAGFVRRFTRAGTYDATATGIDCLYRKQPAAERVGKRALVIRDQQLRRIGVIERDIAL